MIAAAAEARPSQQDLFLREDQCILVDEHDRAVGSASKLACHTGQGALHRAFSVLLFDTKGRLLLQQRAACKPTFPLLWTNTCCSHPLSTCEGEGETEGGAGAKRAAVRKLQQELGIPAGQAPLDAFRFATRLLYRARHDDRWVEHEIDYILVLRADVTLDINSDEVAACKYVTKDEMRQMLEDNKQTKVLTPWFTVIAEKWLFQWWDALESGDHESLSDDGAIHSVC
eukprot:m51a1_g6533 putative isopentenyl-diphosphate delta-isomerase (228) ;mRNA; r:22015-23301